MTRRLFFSFAVVLGTLAFAGCDNMQHQENVRTFTPAPDAAGASSARKPPEHVVARGSPDPADPLVSGVTRTNPLPLSRAMLLRGQDLFNADCATCHGMDGYGQGIVVRRGFPAPASLHSGSMRDLTDGQVFQAISRGYGIMYPMADRIELKDRWAIVAYVRALQLSQHLAVNRLSAEERAALALP